jgi:heme exporter protein D
MISAFQHFSFSAFLGQLTPTQWPAVAQWLAGAVAVLAVLYLLMATIVQSKKLLGRQPPLEVTFCTRVDCDKTHAEVRRELTRIWEKVDEMKTDIMAAIERNRVAVDVQLTEIRSDLARLDERSKQS